MRGKGEFRPARAEPLPKEVDPPVERKVLPDHQHDRELIARRLWSNVSTVLAPFEEGTTDSCYKYKVAEAKTAADKEHFKYPTDLTQYHDALYTPGQRTR
mmetsp:Transcript_18515/g.47657  ORF Transcript_18515/g.47657 Transcript_18515/m.47657 type:complete len:100 (-) Transcript_18515:453-752(-)